MPIGPGKYRFKRGTNMRLHFGPGGNVNEAKNMATGATHTPAEFAADAMAPKKRTPGRSSGATKRPAGLMKINIGPGELDV